MAAQKTAITKFLCDKQWTLLAEYEDVASGSCDSREGLGKAIAHAKKSGATLVIAKLDRVSRRVSLIAALMESNVKFAIADMPEATTFQIHIYSAMAEEERRLISQRTKAALAESKKRGTVLGKYGKTLAAKNKRNATAFAANYKDILVNLRDSGLSFKSIAEDLNNRKIASSTGGKWHSQTVQRAYERVAQLA